MPVIESKIDVRSESFAQNRADMLALVDEFRALENKIRQSGESKRELFTKRGQILPRERLALGSTSLSRADWAEGTSRRTFCFAW